MEQIQYSETLGFDYCLIAEHHFTNYGNSPAPLLQALYIGRRTRRIGIGTASVILPMWQPLRLAEEVAVLDNLLDGRFMCGVGRGYQPYEMAGFGADVGESRARFDETLDVLLKAWTSHESFTYQGEYVNIDRPVTVFPKPSAETSPAADDYRKQRRFHADRRQAQYAAIHLQPDGTRWRARPVRRSGSRLPGTRQAGERHPSRRPVHHARRALPTKRRSKRSNTLAGRIAPRED